jgi:ParB family chromosome partitioning protein
MVKKTRMGRNLNALLGGATKNRPADEPAQSPTSPATDSSPSPDASAGAVEESKSNDVINKNATHNSTAASISPISSATTSAPISDSSNSVQSANDSSAAQAPIVEADMQSGDKLRMLGVDQISRGTYQPRRHFDQELLQELADSITAQGLIQPILVRAYAGKFELIAGERRWRAAQLAGITDIPAIVRDMDDQSVAAVSLIENIQRADLNPLEEAHALERLCNEFSMTHQQVAEEVGRSRVAVTNLMRLLELHDDVKQLVDTGELDMGHARAILGAPRGDQPDIARRVITQNMTVRAVEKLVKDLREGKSPAKPVAAKPDPNIEALREKLSTLLGAAVAIKHKKGGSGTLEISYSSVDELEGILKHIN